MWNSFSLTKRNSLVDELGERYSKFQLPPESHSGCKTLPARPLLVTFAYLTLSESRLFQRIVTFILIALYKYCLLLTYVRVSCCWVPPLLSIFGRKKLSRFRPKFDGLGINRGLKLNLSFITPKRHILVWFHVFWAIARKNPSTGLTCSLIKEKIKV